MDKISVSLLMIACLLYGCFIGSTFFKPAPKIITTVVSTPATDEQLIEFWFGNGDKKALRERICK